MDTYDVIVVGGGPAGLSAALVLGRARRRVLLCDAGEGRNAPAPEAHGVFTRDGTPPAELRRIGREQLRPYPVEVRDTAVTAAARVGDGFEVTLTGGERAEARRLLLATGMADDLPPVPGLAERWGRSVFQCPYCHGWEARDRPLAVLARGAAALHLAPLLTGWTDDVVLLTDGPADLTPDERARLAALGIPVREERIARLEGIGDALERVVFAGGEALAREGLLVAPAFRQRSDLPAHLGCTFTETGAVRVDELGRTDAPGVSAAGDAANRMPQIALAAASGVLAGAGLNSDLLAEDQARRLAARELVGAG